MTTQEKIYQKIAQRVGERVALQVFKPRLADAVSRYMQSGSELFRDPFDPNDFQEYLDLALND